MDDHLRIEREFMNEMERRVYESDKEFMNDHLICWYYGGGNTSIKTSMHALCVPQSIKTSMHALCVPSTLHEK